MAISNLGYGNSEAFPDVFTLGVSIFSMGVVQACI